MDILNINSWACTSGLLPIHLSACEKDERYIMLDGGFFDFCLDIAKGVPEPSDFISRAWSSNTKNYIHYCNEKIVVVYNWLKDKPESLPAEIVGVKFSQFISILNKSSYRTSDDVAPFVLGLFRQLRNQTRERREPLEALNLLYRLLVAINEDNITGEVCKKWEIQEVATPTGFDGLVEKIRNGSRNIKPNLDLILRHSSGRLFQEAHREAESFDCQ